MKNRRKVYLPLRIVVVNHGLGASLAEIEMYLSSLLIIGAEAKNRCKVCLPLRIAVVNHGLGASLAEIEMYLLLHILNNTTFNSFCL